MAKVIEIRKGRRNIGDFTVVGDVLGYLGESRVTIQGADLKLLKLQGRNVSFAIIPDERGQVKVGKPAGRLTAIDFWRVPADGSAPSVSINIVPKSSQ